MRAQNEPPERVVRLNARRRGRSRRRARSGDPRTRCTSSASTSDARAPGFDLAAEPRLAARRAGRRRASRASACSTSAPRPAGRRRSSPGRGRRGREAPGPRPRARGELQAARRERTCASSTPTRSTLPDDLRGFDRALVDAPCSGLGVLAARPDLRWRGKPLPELQRELLARRGRARAAGRRRSSTRSARSTRTRTRRSSTRPASRSSPLGEEWPQFAHPRRPEFLLTLPAPRPHVRLLHRARADGSCTASGRRE